MILVSDYLRRVFYVTLISPLKSWPLKLWIAIAFYFFADIALSLLSAGRGLELNVANLVGMAAGLAVFLIAYGKRTIPERDSTSKMNAVKMATGLLLVILMALFLRAGVLALLIQKGAFGVTIAVIVTAAITAFFVGGGTLVLLDSARRYTSSVWKLWRTVAAGMILFLFLLKSLLLVLPCLIPEEAYYWNYSQHLDWGYLDHPPMVSWLIKLGTLLLGTTEAGVRLGAFVSWIVAATFIWKMTRRLFGPAPAATSVLLMSTLPFYFGVGFLMTPDAPLVACWAGVLYFFQRVFIDEDAAAWYGAGVCIGLGMLSKYTIGLLVPSVVLFMLVDREARRWWSRPQPYIAALLALILFAPVVIWNAAHGWASFAFQTERRLSAQPHFSLHLLLGSVLALLTPTIFFAFMAGLSQKKRQLRDFLTSVKFPVGRIQTMIFVFSIVPLFVFVLFSLTHEPKLNWTGPVWLAVLPVVSVIMTQAAKGWLARTWKPTIVVFTVVYGIAFYYLIWGLPGLGYPAHMSDIAGWPELGRQIRPVIEQIKMQTGEKPLLAGMDLYNISSELAFYTYPNGPKISAGRHLWGDNSLMYRYWFPDSLQVGRNVIIVGRDKRSLSASTVVRHFDSLGTAETITIMLNNETIEHFFYRVGYGYRPLK